MKRRICALFTAAMLLCGCAAQPQKRQAMWYDWFDTVATLVAYTDEETFAAMQALTAETLAFYHRQYDIYHTYDGVNNLCTVNEAKGEPMAVDDAILDLLALAAEMYDLTDGRLNVALGNVLALWHEARETKILPTDGALQAAAAHTDIAGLRIDTDAKTVQLADPDLRLDVGAVAKGYAVEQTALALIAAGFDNFALNVGGNVRVVGVLPDGRDWTVGIQDPDGDGYLCRVALTDATVATSGSYQRFVDIGGVRYHHIIDKNTLYPAKGFTSVSVIAPDSGVADALSTALFCMPLDEGRALVDSLDGVEALWLDTEGVITMTDRFPTIGDAP